MAGPVYWNIPPITDKPPTGWPSAVAIVGWPSGRRHRGHPVPHVRGPVPKLWQMPAPLRWAAAQWGNPEGGMAQNEQYVSQAAQALAMYQSAQDPRVLLATTEAKIANYKRMRKQAPILGAFYTNEIAKLEAKAAALREKLAITQEGEDATRTWRGLGQTGLAVGVVGAVIGVGILALVATKLAKD